MHDSGMHYDSGENHCVEHDDEAATEMAAGMPGSAREALETEVSYELKVCDAHAAQDAYRTFIYPKAAALLFPEAKYCIVPITSEQQRRREQENENKHRRNAM